MMLRVRRRAVDDEGSLFVLTQIPCVEDEFASRQAPSRGDAEALEFHLGSRIEYARRRIALDQRIKLTGRNLGHRVFHVNPLAEILARHVRTGSRGETLSLPRAQSAIQHSNVRVAAFFQ